MKRIVTICWFSCLVIAARAQEASPTQVPAQLSYKEALKIAIKNNVTLNQEKNNLELSEGVRANRIAQLAPTINGTLTASRIHGNFFNNNEGQVMNGVTDQMNGSIDANMML